MADLFWLYTWFHSFNDYVDYCKIAQSLSRDTLRTAKSLFSFFFFFFLFDPFCFLWFNLRRKNLVRLSNLCCWKLYYYIYRPNDVSHDNYLLYLRVQFPMGHIWWSSLKLWMCDSAHFTFPMTLPSSPKIRSPYFKDQVSCSIHKSATILDITSHRRRSCTESRRLRLYHRSYIRSYILPWLQEREERRGPCPVIDSFPSSVLSPSCVAEVVMTT